MPIFNISYSPELNCIETCFSFVKQAFKRMRLNDLANDRPFDMEATIRQSFGILTPDLVDACAKRSYYLLNNIKV